METSLLHCSIQDLPSGKPPLWSSLWAPMTLGYYLIVTLITVWLTKQNGVSWVREWGDTGLFHWLVSSLEVRDYIIFMVDWPAQHPALFYDVLLLLFQFNRGGNWCIGGDLVRLTQLVSSRAGIWTQAVSLTLESMLLTLNLFHLSNEIVNFKDGDRAYHLLAQCLHSPHLVNISPLVLPCTLAEQQTEYIELGLSS